MKKNKCIKIYTGNFNKINSICSDGDYIYLTQNNCNIISGVKIKEKGDCSLKVPFNIGAICYDLIEDSFWITDVSNSSRLINIDKNGKVLKEISLKPIVEQCYNYNINTIEFNGNDNTFLISIKENATIYIMNKSSILVEIITNLELTSIKDIKIFDEKIFVYTDKRIDVYNERFRKINSMDVSEFNSNVFLVNKVSELSYVILIVAQVENTISLCEYLINNDCIDDFDDCINDCKNKSEDSKKNDCCCCGDAKCFKDKKMCEIIETISLQGAGIAHILNEEGEKIQKAIKICTDYKGLISVNSSVTETLEKIVELEIVLTNKLRRLQKMMKECNYDHNFEEDYNCNNCDYENNYELNGPKEW